MSDGVVRGGGAACGADILVLLSPVSKNSFDRMLQGKIVATCCTTMVLLHLAARPALTSGATRTDGAKDWSTHPVAGWFIPILILQVTQGERLIESSSIILQVTQGERLIESCSGWFVPRLILQVNKYIYIYIYKWAEIW